MVLTEASLTEAAAESTYTREELSQTDQRLEQAIQSRIHYHFKRCRLRRGPNYWLLEDSRGDPGFWLALNKYDLTEEMREADYDYDSGRLFTVAYAYLEAFQSDGRTIAVPGTVGRSYDDPFFFPIHVRYPETWRDGEWHTLQRFQECVSRYEMSPAEALDYWAVERMGEQPADWAGKRDVQPEAVRKNVRQARQKRQDDELGSTHENGDIHPVAVEEVPDGRPHDAEADLFYVPTDESLESVTDPADT